MRPYRSLVRKPLGGCNGIVQATSALCGHKFEVFCRLAPDFEKNIWSPETLSTLCTSRILSIDARGKRDLASINIETKQFFRKCDGRTIVALKCGHEKSVKCSDLLSSLCSPVGDLHNVCTVPVTVSLACGNEVEAPCDESTQYKAGNVAAIKCSKTRSQKCWNHAVCCTSRRVKCFFEGAIACSEVCRWTCATRTHKYDIRLCTSGIPRDCPGYSADRLQAEIRDPHNIPAPNLITYLDFLPPECIEPDAAACSSWKAGLMVAM